MRAFALAAGLTILMAFTGCARRPAPAPYTPPPPPAMTPERLAGIRAEFQKADPSARVGMITAVKTDKDRSLAAIEDINLEGLREGDVVSIVSGETSNQDVLAEARVLRVDGKILVVKYTPVSGAPREPDKGDLAVTYKK